MLLSAFLFIRFLSTFLSAFSCLRFCLLFLSTFASTLESASFVYFIVYFSRSRYVVIGIILQLPWPMFNSNLPIWYPHHHIHCFFNLAYPLCHCCILRGVVINRVGADRFSLSEPHIEVLTDGYKRYVFVTEYKYKTKRNER